MSRNSHGLNIRRFVKQNEGAAGIEYAVTLAIVVLCVTAGVYCIGQLSGTQFAAASDALGSISKQDAPTENAVAEPEPRSDVREVPTSFILIVGVTFFLVACGAPLVYFLARRRHQTQPDPEDGSTQVVETPSETDAAFAKRQQIRRVFQNNMSTLLKGDLKARHIMSRQITCVKPSAPAATVTELIETKRIGHVLVRDDANKLVGIISQKDSINRKGNRASDLMTSPPLTLDMDAKLSIGITQLISRRVTCLPVLGNNQELTGIITSTDFLLAFQCAIQTLEGVVNQLELPANHTQTALKSE